MKDWQKKEIENRLKEGRILTSLLRRTVKEIIELSKKYKATIVLEPSFELIEEPFGDENK